MTEKWWRAFLPKKRNTDPVPDFNPFAQQSEKIKDSTNASKMNTTDQTVPAQDSNLPSIDTFDDSNLESVFNEQTCRRNMKVSRSGRFKEKRRPRTTVQFDK